MNDILPDTCPFCGGDSVKVQTRADNRRRLCSRYRAYVRCLKCHARGPVVSRDTEAEAVLSAVDAWNWRIREVEERLDG
ncbi:MAG: Lar family restriction alleviation protein [Clostridia bacterium]|nr:Lar family restriction alleviation protein [Clostridia bacterium]